MEHELETGDGIYVYEGGYSPTMGSDRTAQVPMRLQPAGRMAMRTDAYLDLHETNQRWRWKKPPWGECPDEVQDFLDMIRIEESAG